jgi:cation:H+ antiporter
LIVEHVGPFVLGLILLAVGAPLLVFGAARLDRATGRGPFAVGIVAVAFGPCVAALAFDLAVVLRHPPLTRPVVGHLVGHNLASLGLALGLAAVVRPIAATAKLFRTAILLVFGATALFWFLARSGSLPQVNAGFLLAAFVVSLVLLVIAARRETEEVKAEFASWLPERLPILLAMLFALAGLASLVGGAYLTAAHIVGTAVHFKAPTLVIAATLGAFITSLPTLIVVVFASLRGRPNVALGVVIGSTLVNILLLAGVSAMTQPLVIDQWVIMDVIPVMALLTLLLVPTLMNGLRVPRWEGLLLLAGYAGFIAWLVRVAQKVAQMVAPG